MILTLNPQPQKCVAEGLCEPKLAYFILKTLDAFFFCSYSATFEPRYVSSYHSLLVAKSAQIGPCEVSSIIKNKVTFLLLFYFSPTCRHFVVFFLLSKSFPVVKISSYSHFVLFSMLLLGSGICSVVMIFAFSPAVFLLFDSSGCGGRFTVDATFRHSKRENKCSSYRGHFPLCSVCFHQAQPGRRPFFVSLSPCHTQVWQNFLLENFSL